MCLLICYICAECVFSFFGPILIWHICNEYVVTYSLHMHGKWFFALHLLSSYPTIICAFFFVLCHRSIPISYLDGINPLLAIAGHRVPHQQKAHRPTLSPYGTVGDGWPQEIILSWGYIYMCLKSKHMRWVNIYLRSVDISLETFFKL